MDISEVVNRVVTPDGIRPTVRYPYGYMRTGEWEEIDNEMYEDGPGIVLPDLGSTPISEYEKAVLDLQPLTDDEVLEEALSNSSCSSPVGKRSSLLSRYSYDEYDKERQL